MDNHIPRNPSAAVSINFMNMVYLWMVFGVLLTGLTAYVAAQYLPLWLIYLRYTPHGLNIFMGTFYGLLALQLAQVIIFTLWFNRMSEFTAIFIYLFYAFSVGLTFSFLFLVYKVEDISGAFFVTSFAFAGLCCYGYFTQRDLQALGTFCTMGLFALIGIGVYSLIFPAALSDGAQMTIDLVGIFIFCGLTAFDAQKIKQLDYDVTTKAQLEKRAIYGALRLYLDFINLFIRILRIMGKKR